MLIAAKRTLYFKLQLQNLNVHHVCDTVLKGSFAHVVV